jgi:ABC-type xylose transport system permease subunit
MSSTEHGPADEGAVVGAGTVERVEQADEVITDKAAIAAGAPPELIAGSVGEYARIWLKRVRSGESGALPVVLGLVAIVIFFQARNSLFLSAGNLVNLLVQGAPFVMLGMAEVFVLLLGEIDLSVGFNAGIGAVVTLWAVYNLPWWAAILLGLAATAFIGFFQGSLITRLGLPSFVVTLAGLLGLEGLLIILVARTGHGAGGSISNPNNIIYDLTAGNLSPVAGWIVMIVIVGLAAVFMILRDRRRRANGLVAPPLGVTLLKVAVMAVAGVVVVLIGNTDRGVGLSTLRGVPWVVFIVLGVLVLWTVVTSRTRFGRYIYAIGGNAEAARRAGVNLIMVRTLAFTLCGLTAGIGGIILASRLDSIGTNLDGGQLVLFAVASAVIGGTNLFGGRGRMLNALLGGLVVATIYNGLGLIGLSAAATDIVTAIVLLAAVTIDTQARRRGISTS